MKKTLALATFLAGSLFAITPEQQVELDKIFNGYIQNINKNTSLSENRKEKIIKDMNNKKKEIESKSDEEIQIYLDKNSGDSARIANAKQKEKELGIKEEKPTSPDAWLGYLFGASGAKTSFFYGGNLTSAYMVYGSIGPKYNFSSEGWSMIRSKGFSLSLPIGLGAINTSGIKNDVDFVLPIALEANYMFSDGGGFGLSSGVRYTYSPQERGDLHMMDFYAGIDIYYGYYMEIGYVFYSSQDIKFGKNTISTDPLSGAVTLNIGLRF